MESMPGDREATVETYNRSATELAAYFAGIGSRIKDIEIAFQLAGDPADANVMEIGCGDGRDAEAIVERAGRYVGFDISEGMIGLARARLSDARFEVADALDFTYPENTDIVFAFASLLHLDQEEVSKVFGNVAQNLNPGGIFFVSIKYAAEYRKLIQEDRFGKRLYYLYNRELLEDLAGEDYQTVYAEKSILGNTEWLEIAFRKL